MKKTKHWDQIRNDEAVKCEVDVLDSGEVTIALWTNYLDQYIDIVLTPQQADELRTHINKE